jgi:hypothetical protein
VIAVEITFRGIPPSPELHDLIERQTARLVRVCEHLQSCRVAVERPWDRTHDDCRVRIDVTVPPHHELVVSRTTSDDGHEPPARIVRAAFRAARRRVRELREQTRTGPRRSRGPAGA